MRISDSVIKFTSPSIIQYNFITNTTSYTNDDFYTTSLKLLQGLPSDLLQLQNSINHYDFNFRYKAIKSYELFTFPSFFFNSDIKQTILDFKEYCSAVNISKINVFIIDSSVKDHDKIAEFLNVLEIAYFTIIPTTDKYAEGYNSSNFFSNEFELINLFNRDISIINNLIKEYYKAQEENIELDGDLLINPNGTFLSSNTSPGSLLSHNNYFILNQVIGNVWIEGKNNLEKIITNVKERSQEIIDQCNKIDNISMIMYNHVGIKATDPFQPLLPTLILIAPYHFPKREKIFGKPTPKEKKWLSILKAEQNLNYEHVFVEEEIKRVYAEELNLLMRQTSLRLRYLDAVGYLHARFTYSPVIRLPQIGKSINKELSHLEQFSSNKTTTISNIKKFGIKLRDYLFSVPLQDYLKDRNGQIFTISDLPMEWLFLEDYPLCFTHDVCRIPEFNLNGLVNSTIHLQRYLYEIPRDLINKTLIIHCSSKNDKIMNDMFEIINGYKDSHGFNSKRCSSVEEIAMAIDEFKPDLLIFDCHGGSDKNNLSSFLIIDQEKEVYLTGDDIVKFKLSAPLVFLSACETMPNYGYVKLISDAFMEAGAYSVTTTFLPINIKDATSLIVRLLSNLVQLKSKSYHINWLSFMSHILRTCLIFETINKSRKFLTEEITTEEIAEIMTKSMKFELRFEALAELDRLLTKKSKSKKLRLIDLENEWMMYSIIGRADLIYFKNWLEDYRDLNFNDKGK
ncbi:CHAT domain-containing protein [Flavobacterium araucananum]|uniref:CHAT domain-containing protein n=1 Tax=Flavobacterium araucananum TaxID=946678 RepID=UPI000D6CB3C1|nr:CHAT domain-containing protein [Flavobacterium araucananum]PWJ91292.1 CHAT domain-containing protein [Flavobacterium araucananum]